ncbi:MAG: sensor histidine kinase [Alkalispirochaeta sp.]
MKRQAYFTQLLISFFVISMLPLVTAGIGFSTLSLRIVQRAIGQRGSDAAAVAADAVAAHLDTYRHIAYSVSKTPVVQDIFRADQSAGGQAAGPRDRHGEDSAWLKELYRVLYKEIEGHLYETSIHLVSADGRRAYSTHELPSRYDLSDYSNLEGIFSEFRPDADRTYFYLDPFFSERGERVAGSFLRDIEGGFVIVDVLAAPLISAAAQPVFDTMILTEVNQLKAVDFFRPERDGTFDHFKELSFLDEFMPRDLKEGKPLVKGSLLIVPRQIGDSSLILVGTVMADQYRIALGALWGFGLWILLGVLVIIVVLAFRLSRDIGGPVHAVVEAMEHLSDGIPATVPETGRNDELGFLVSSYNRMVRQLDELLERTRNEERALRVAERKALQAQVNPHFLYNTLGTIKSLAKLKGVPEIVDIATGLGTMFRSAIDNDNVFVSLAESLDLLRGYVDIQRHRFGSRLDVEFHIPDDLLDRSIPRLILQPIVENAMIHALESSPLPISIRVSAQNRDDGMEITITDNGPGIDPARLAELTEHSGRVGITNVRRRMELHYQGRGDFRIESAVGKGTTVILFFPGGH